MAWFRVRLSEEEQRIVGEERQEHPHGPTRRKMDILWLLHHGLTREKVAKIVGVGLATVNRHAKAYRDGGLDGLRCWGKKAGPVRWRPIANCSPSRSGSDRLQAWRRRPTASSN